MGTVERIFYLLNEKKMEQKEFASKIGVSENVVSTWRTGRTKSYSRYLSKIAEVLNTTPEYLLTGQDSASVLSKDLDALDVLAIYDQLPEAERIRFLGIVEGRNLKK